MHQFYLMYLIKNKYQEIFDKYLHKYLIQQF